MFEFDYITIEDIKEHNSDWPKIPDHSYWILIIRGSGSGKKGIAWSKKSRTSYW